MKYGRLTKFKIDPIFRKVSVERLCTGHFLLENLSVAIEPINESRVHRKIGIIESPMRNVAMYLVMVL